MTTAPSRRRTFIADQSFRMLIGGVLVGPSGGAVTETLDPSTGAVLTSVPEASAGGRRPRRRGGAPRPARVAGARASAGRGACFARLGELLMEHRERLALLDAVDCGNPLRAMRIDVDICLQYLAAYPAMAWGLHGRVIDASSGLHYTRTRPYGVAGRILAFNHPMMFAVTRPLPALITGQHGGHEARPADAVVGAGAGGAVRRGVPAWRDEHRHRWRGHGRRHRPPPRHQADRVHRQRPDGARHPEGLRRERRREAPLARARREERHGGVPRCRPARPPSRAPSSG